MGHAPIVALGNQRYRVERPWGNLPPPLSYTGIANVTVAPSGKVFILLRGDPTVVVFSPEGNVIDQWSLPDIVCGHYIRAVPSGKIMLADFDGHRIFIFTEDGRCERILGDRENPRLGAPFNHPADAVEASDGEIYVADGYGNSCVHRFAADGTLLATWGRPGKGKLEFSTPHSVAIDAANRVLVTDRENGRVQILDRDGKWLGEIGDLYRPMALVPTPDGGFLVTDQTPRLSLYSASGELVGRCRTFGLVGHGLGLSPDGSIFVSDMWPDMLARFTPIA